MKPSTKTKMFEQLGQSEYRLVCMAARSLANFVKCDSQGSATEMEEVGHAHQRHFKEMTYAIVGWAGRQNTPA
jgi:hypothetical protein